jgi:hypothetical protein
MRDEVFRLHREHSLDFSDYCRQLFVNHELVYRSMLRPWMTFHFDLN